MLTSRLSGGYNPHPQEVASASFTPSPTTAASLDSDRSLQIINGRDDSLEITTRLDCACGTQFTVAPTALPDVPHCDLVPWPFLDADRPDAWMVWSYRRPGPNMYRSRHARRLAGGRRLCNVVGSIDERALNLCLSGKSLRSPRFQPPE
jgi:hypothetical protein